MPKGSKRPDPGPSVKDKDLYERLREEGNSKEKAARMTKAELVHALREH